MNYGAEIGRLLHALRETEATLARMERRPQANTGALHRLRREARKLEAKIEKLRTKEREAAERKVQKAREQRRKARLTHGERKQLRRTPLKQGKPLKTKAPMKAVNKERQAKAKEEQFSIADGYRGHVMRQPCIRCGRYHPEELRDPAHMLGVDLGGKAHHLLPLCRVCHIWQEVHKKEFDEEFTARHGMAPLEMAAALRQGYLDAQPRS